MSQLVQAMFDGEALFLSHIVVALGRYHLSANVLYGAWFSIMVLKKTPSNRVVGGIGYHVYLLRRIELAKDRIARYCSLEREDGVALCPRPFFRWDLFLLALQ